MRLRVRTPNGQQSVGASLGPLSTLGDLRAEIAAVSGIQIEFLQLKAGFPPKVLARADSETLADCGIKDGEQLTAESVSTAAATTASASAPLAPAVPSSTSSAPKAPSSRNDEAIPFGEGFVVPRIQDDDNSCLFRSIGYVCLNSSGRHAELRKVVADAITANPFEYNEAILGRSPEAYANWILQKNSWGGAIELAIFSNHFKREICSVDVSTLRVDRFGEGQFDKRVLVMYSGIHYDAIALTPSPDLPRDFDQTEFSVTDGDGIVEAAVNLASVWKQKRKFTDTANFTLKCGVCGKGLVGEKDATNHAKATGHTNFTEY